MSAVSVARIDELPAAESDLPGGWHPIRHPMGIEAFGANAWSGDAGVEVIEEHDEVGGGAASHEELYLVVRGNATFTVAGDAIQAPAGTLVAITDPTLVRRAVAREDGTLILAVGAPRGEAYEVADWERRHMG